ncbi:MAG: threonine/serine exporter family protein [Spirochaetes bacterium]|nr:threonine/serine exporter family protein [Spirochaetota bacterium]MBU1079703.1 threonine/serine exporter family protein [Spirochaetota bacterium]
MSGAYLQLLWALLATLGFGVLFRAPVRDLPFAALGGALAWGAYLAAAAATGSDSLSFFAASFAVGLYAEAAAALLKRPATLFIISAIIPLVPGAGMYRTMFEAVAGNASAAAATGFQTLIMAGAIAGGLAVASSVSRIFWLKKPTTPRFLRRRRRRKLERDDKAEPA